MEKELKEQIDREAKAGQHTYPGTDYGHGFNKGYDSGYKFAGEKYAELWQAAEARIQELHGELEKYSLLVSSKISELQAAEAKAERYEKALKDIINPIAYLQRKAEEEGGAINGHIAQELASSVPFIQSIATEALTPKISSDENLSLDLEYRGPNSHCKACEDEANGIKHIKATKHTCRKRRSNDQ